MMSTRAPSILDSPETIGYDHVMLLEDPQSTSKNKTESSIVKFVFLASCGFVALIGGFGLQLAVSSRRHRVIMKKKPVQDEPVVNKELEDPVLFASRALGWGTIFAVLGTGSIGLVAVGIRKLLSYIRITTL